MYYEGRGRTDQRHQRMGGGAMTMRRRGSESGKMPSGMTHVKRTSRTGRQRIWDRGRMDPFSHWFLNI